MMGSQLYDTWLQQQAAAAGNGANDATGDAELDM